MMLKLCSFKQKKSQTASVVLSRLRKFAEKVYTELQSALI